MGYNGRGRPKGSPNKKDGISYLLAKRGMSLADEAVNLYQASHDPEFKLKVLNLLMPYVYPKADILVDDAIDITPETMSLDDLKRLEASASKGIEEIRQRIKEREPV